MLDSCLSMQVIKEKNEPFVPTIKTMQSFSFSWSSSVHFFTFSSEVPSVRSVIAQLWGEQVVTEVIPFVNKNDILQTVAGNGDICAPIVHPCHWLVTLRACRIPKANDESLTIHCHVLFAVRCPDCLSSSHKRHGYDRRVVCEKNGMANRRGVSCVSVGQKALKEASLSNIGTTKQNDLGVNVCLALLCVSHHRSCWSSLEMEKRKEICEKKTINHTTRGCSEKKKWKWKSGNTRNQCFPMTNQKHYHLGHTPVWYNNAHLQKQCRKREKTRLPKWWRTIQKLDIPISSFSIFKPNYTFPPVTLTNQTRYRVCKRVNTYYFTIFKQWNCYNVVNIWLLLHK